MCIQKLLLTLNSLDVMVTLGVYFEHIKFLCRIFTKYITTVLQVYPSYFIIFPTIITNDIHYYFYCIIKKLFLLISL
jgi:hypothetical protein